VPAGVTHLLVELWGAGGGGGGDIDDPANGFFSAGSGGGGGGYTRTVVPVVPSTTYNIIVGTGGTGGFAATGSGSVGTPGSAGQSSSVTDSSFTVSATAAGGAGGGPGAINPVTFQVSCGIGGGVAVALHLQQASAARDPGDSPIRISSEPMTLEDWEGCLQTAQLFLPADREAWGPLLLGRPALPDMFWLAGSKRRPRPGGPQ